MRIKRWLAIALVLLAPAAQATDYCVQDDATFRSALTLATIAPGETRILLGAGKTFHLADSPLDTGYATSFRPKGNVVIEGGYNADCSASSTHDAASTVLDGTGSDDVVIVTGNNFTLSTLTVGNLFAEFNLGNPSGGVGADGMRLRLLHARFLDGANVHVALTDVADAEVRVENSLFARLSGLPPAGSANDSGALEVGVDGGPKAILIGNTISRNSRNGLLTVGAPVFAYDNILYGNNLIGGAFLDWRVYDSGDLPYAVRNIVGSFNGSYLTGSNNNLGSDPLFVSATDFNLQIASPARESGTASVPGGLSAYDVAGGERVVGTAVDRGAFEADSSGASVLLVTNTNDAGAGSLRAAIADANANPAANVIGFNIPGACPRTIALQTELPAITDDISIRGYTQPGAQPNTSALSDNATICVELVEATGQTIANGLRFAPTASSSSQDVSGLSIGRFTTGIRFDGPITGTGVGCSAWGNFIGLAADGTTLRANAFAGINVEGRMYCTIGGDDNAQRNVVAGGLAGVRVNGDQTTFVRNNYIGTTRSGNTARPNTIGVALLSGLNYVEDNLVSGNSGNAVTMNGMAAQYNYVRGNRIGRAAFRVCTNPPCAPDFLALPNGADAVYISSGSTGNRITDNTIAFNAGAGVRVVGNGTGGHFIGGNAIYANDGLGIDLGATGVDPIDNDATTPPGTPNRGINAPLLDFAFGGNHNGSVYGRLQTINDDYVVEFFASTDCDPSGHGEGRYPLGTSLVSVTNATATTNGQQSFQAPIAWTGDLPGMAITATVSPAHGSDFPTSEFSQCMSYVFSDVIFADGFDPPPE